jgi:hypothetical protein
MTRIKRENVYPTPGRGSWFRLALLAVALIGILYFAFQEGSDDTPDSLLDSSTSQMLRVDLPDAQIKQKSKMEKYFEDKKANPDGEDADGDDADSDDGDDDSEGEDESESESEGDDEGEAEAEGGDDDEKE